MTFIICVIIYFVIIMNIKVVKVGMLETNCYILESDESCLIIDPGDESNKIIKNINKKACGILITHSHFDHIGAVDELKAKYNCKKYDIVNLSEGIHSIGEFVFEVIYTPGHKEDLISFLFDDKLFCGDFIFNGCIGRYDLSGGSIIDMKKSIKKILEYNPNIMVYPGHGDFTTLRDETKMLNKYLSNI